MLEIVSWFLIALITHILDCYVFCKLVKQKFRFNILMFLIIIFFCLCDCYIGIINNKLIKITITNLFTFIILQTLYKKNISKTLISTLFIYIGYLIAEIIFSIIFILLLEFDINFFIEGIGLLFVNLFEFIIFFIMFKNKLILDFISKIMKWYESNKIFDLAFRTIIIMLLCSILIYIINFKNLFEDRELLIILILLVIVLFVCGYFKEKSGNNKLNIEYTQLLDYVKTYEDEVVDKSKKQHEYKNQLIIIDSLISKTNKKAKGYLKKVLNNVEDVTDNDWLVKLKNLPSGGIKGLIHFKIKKMIDKKISVFVYVDKELANKNIWENIEKNLEDISRILGIYLDNAMEASEKSIDKQIIIEFVNNKEDIEFILSNSYDGNINFVELDKEGYSTKGKGRGIGLALVKDIIDNNKILNQSREINGKFYVQKLYIKK